MAVKPHEPEKKTQKLQQVDVLVGQAMTGVDTVREIRIRAQHSSILSRERSLAADDPGPESDSQNRHQIWKTDLRRSPQHVYFCKMALSHSDRNERFLSWSRNTKRPGPIRMRFREGST